jgi:integrase
MRRINVRNNRGRCLIRFKYAGVPYSITQGNYGDPVDLAKAEHTADTIYFDLLAGHFDSTLLKYRPELAEQQQREARELELLKNPSLESYARFVEYKRTQMQYSSWKGYRALLNRLESYNADSGFPVTAEQFRSFLNAQDVKDKTQKNYHTYATAYGDWLVSNGLSVNPYKGLSIRVDDRPLPEPFTKQEITAIILELAERNPNYANFVRFKFSTGVRTGEAVGLRWSDIDFEGGYIKIYESVTKAELGEKVRKSTKTRKGRTIPLSGSLRKTLLNQKLLQADKPKAKESGLIFPNGYGNPIDSSKFAEDFWKPTLEKLGIPYREPYTTRHTFISHALAQGMNPLEVSKLTGHDVATLFKHYAGLIDKVQLPDVI